MSLHEPGLRLPSKVRALDKAQVAARDREKMEQDARIDKVLATVDHLVEQVDRYTDENSPENRRKRTWERAEVYGLWAAAFIGATAIFFSTIDSREQLSAMRNELSEMKNGRSQSAGYFRTDERAWIEIANVSLSKPPEKSQSQDGKDIFSFSYEISLKNLGKTAAYTVRILPEPRDEIETIDGHRRVDVAKLIQNLRDNDVSAPEVIAPESTLAVPIRMIRQEEKRIRIDLPSTKVEPFSTPVAGRVTYSDAFNVEHWLDFCFMIADDSGRLRPCEAGNDEDRNAEVDEH